MQNGHLNYAEIVFASTSSNLHKLSGERSQYSEVVHASTGAKQKCLQSIEEDPNSPQRVGEWEKSSSPQNTEAMPYSRPNTG